MSKSITETLKKINTELAGQGILSVLVTFIIIVLFIGYKIDQNPHFLKTEPFSYIESNYTPKNSSEANARYIYASSRGKKYYFFNCKSTIKETNKIFFASEDAAKKAGYSLAKACQ